MKLKFLLFMVMIPLFFVNLVRGETWNQDRFVIGAWFAPRLTGDIAADNERYEQMFLANFNLIVGVNHAFFSYRDNVDILGKKSNLYALQRVADINTKYGAKKLGLIVLDFVQYYIFEYKEYT